MNKAKTRDEGAGHTTERGSKLTVPLRKIHKYYVNIKHYKKYKNPMCKNDKNESLLQPRNSLSSRNYQLVEDYVTTAFAGDRLPGVKVSDVIVCTKSSRLALEYVRFKLVKRTKSTS